MIERQLGLGFVLVVLFLGLTWLSCWLRQLLLSQRLWELVAEFGGVIKEEFVDANVAAEVLGLVEQGLEFGDRNGANVVVVVAAAVAVAAVVVVDRTLG